MNKTGTRKPKNKKLNATLGAGLSVVMLATPAVGATSAFAAESPTNPELVDIDVSGHWIGNKAADIDVTLLADGTPVDTVTLDETDKWLHTFESVAATDKDGDINYSIQTEDLPNYREHVSGNEQDGFSIVNIEHTDSPEFVGTTRDIDVTASWIGQAGDQAEVALLVNEFEADTITLTADNNWSYTFQDMPVVEDENGNVMEYTVVEKNIEGYDTIISGSLLQGFVVSNIEASDSIVEGSVVAKYVDENGTEIAYRDTISGEVGAEYAVDNKDIRGYSLSKTTGEDVGVFAVGVSEVVYVYEKIDDKTPAVIEGTVVSKFVNESGEEIALRETHSGEINTDYAVNAKDINGYTLKEISGNIASVTGTYEKGITEVTFIYKETKQVQEAVLGSIVTKYVDSDGNEIAPRARVSGNIGADYTAELVKPEGYGLVAVKGDNGGVFEQGITIVTYMYDTVQDPTNNLVVKYLDDDGNDIADRVTQTGKAGDNYTTSEQAINNYEFAYVNGNKTGTFSDYPTVVQYMYADVVAVGDVVIKYVDQDGYEITPQKELSGKVGTSYTTEQPKIDGYVFVEVQGDASGDYAKDVTDVVYVYSETADEQADSTVPDANVGDATTDNNETNPNSDESTNEQADSTIPDANVGDTTTDNNETNIDTSTPVNETNPNPDDSTFDSNVIDVSTNPDESTNEQADSTVPDANVGDATTDDETYVETNPTDVPNPLVDMDTVDADLEALYDTFTFGMSYDEVVAVIGADGKKLADNDAKLNGEVVSGVVSYSWLADDGDALSLSFINDKLVSKSLVADGNVTSDYDENFTTGDMTDDKAELVLTGNNSDNGPGQNNKKVTDKTGDATGDKPVQGKQLADTSTNTFNMLAIGIGILLAAGAGLFFVNRRRRRDVTDAE